MPYSTPKFDYHFFYTPCIYLYVYIYIYIYIYIPSEDSLWMKQAVGVSFLRYFIIIRFALYVIDAFAIYVRSVYKKMDFNIYYIC